MRNRARLWVAIAVVGLVAASCCSRGDGHRDPRAEERPDAAPSGPYLGQTPPGPTPVLFAPGFISTGLAERDVAMTPEGDELYFSVQMDGGLVSAILVTRQVTGRWTQPEVAPFSGLYPDLEPAISPDGSRLFFMSKRPFPGSDGSLGNEDIWALERSTDGWGEPFNLGSPINTDQPEYFPSVTRDGTLYFTRRAEDRTEYIHRSRWQDGAFQEPELLGPEVNSGETRFNAFIAPDESYLIVCSWGSDDTLGGVDYYVVFRSPDDRWSAPINLGEPINTATGREWSPYVSPDGRYLFFMSSRTGTDEGRAEIPMTYAELQRRHHEPMNGNSDIWWVDAGLIEELRPPGF